MNDTQIIELMGLTAQVGIIIPATTGFIFRTQAGGGACSSPQLEGIYLPIEEFRATSRLLEDFVGRYNQVKVRKFLKAEDLDGLFAAPTLDEVTRTFFPTWFGLASEGPETKSLFEAWVPVMIRAEVDDPLLEPFRGRIVILTYPNSD